MDEVNYEFLRWLAAAAGVCGSIVVALGLSRAVTAFGFTILTVSAGSWILVGLLDDKSALLSEYVVLMAINCLGIWRWGRPHGPGDPGLPGLLRRMRARMKSITS